MTYFPLRQTTCFFIPLVAPCKPLLTLPYTGIGVRFGSTLFLYGDGENVDHRGYAPDVWCDPQDALASVLALLKEQGVVSADACETVREKIVK